MSTNKELISKIIDNDTVTISIHKIKGLKKNAVAVLYDENKLGNTEKILLDIKGYNPTIIDDWYVFDLNKERLELFELGECLYQRDAYQMN